MLPRFLKPIVRRDCDNSLVLNKTSTWKSFYSVQEGFIYYDGKENHQHVFGHLIKWRLLPRTAVRGTSIERRWQMKRQRLTLESRQKPWEHTDVTTLCEGQSWLPAWLAGRCWGGQWSTRPWRLSNGQLDQEGSGIVCGLSQWRGQNVNGLLGDDGTVESRVWWEKVGDQGDVTRGYILPGSSLLLFLSTSCLLWGKESSMFLSPCVLTK